MVTKLEENLEVCRRVAANGGVALRALSLPHPQLAKATAKAIGARLDPAPFFGPRIGFSERFVKAEMLAAQAAREVQP